MPAVTPLDTRYRADALIDVAVPAGFTIILAWLSSQHVSITQGTLAFLLCWMPWRGFRRRIPRSRSGTRRTTWSTILRSRSVMAAWRASW